MSVISAIEDVATMVYIFENADKYRLNKAYSNITIGKGNPEWGAPTEDVFVIKLGKRV